jgi:GntR family transcriptional regulator
MTEHNRARPLYQVVIESLLEKIESGEYQSGERLPSESELCKLYQVGRNTVRHALSELVGRGVLTTVHGVGTFVADVRLDKTAQFLFGFTNEMSRHDAKVTSDVLAAEIIPADAALSRRLQIQLGSEVVFLYRVRKMDGEPVAIERSYLPHELCPGILEYDFSTNSLYETLSNVYNRKPDHAEQEIEASLATPEVARLLELTPPAVVLVFHRETRLANDKVIEYVDSELRADRFRFYSQLRPFAPSEAAVFRRLPIGDASA